MSTTYFTSPTVGAARASGSMSPLAMYILSRQLATLFWCIVFAFLLTAAAHYKSKTGMVLRSSWTFIAGSKSFLGSLLSMFTWCWRHLLTTIYWVLVVMLANQVSKMKEE